MIKIHPVQIALLVSVISLFGFIGFSVTYNTVSNEYEDQIEEVRRNQMFAAERLNMTRKEIVRQRRRADSLEVIVEAQKREEVVWMARALLSETKRPEEMWYVGWVIRNRHENRFRGSTYKDVVLHPKQFSAFNRDYPLRDHYVNLQPTDVGEVPRWHDALRIAEIVIDAPKDWRPLPPDTYHFYSEVSMDGKVPHWKRHLPHVGVSSIDSKRFRFYRGKSTVTTTAATAR